MKNLLLIILVLPFSVHAQQDAKAIKNLTKLLDHPAPGLDCGVETKTPNIKKGEVKIAYDCADFVVPGKKVDQETISFYSDPGLDEKGLIIRSRVNKKDPSERDVTIKFRPEAGEKIALEKLMYDSLKAKSDAAKDDGSKSIELKCEADVSYGPKYVNSCSLTTTTEDLTADHQAFAQMSTSSTVKGKLGDYQVMKIDAQSWKIAQVDFAKGISVERWDLKNNEGKDLCLLEVSAKFEVEDTPKSDLPQRLKAEADKAMAKLQAAFPDKKPAQEQGNKTSRAFQFTRSH